jgi:2-hydroxy-3-keto-5-methylthiopentenyl-1-phosphate phosphatase
MRSAALIAWNILCDFDGTITLEDVIDSLLEHFGLPGWERLEDDWRAGRIGSRECMSGQVALLDLDREQLDQHLSGQSIDPGFPAFVAEARRLGAPLRIVSDGLDYAIDAVLARHGLADLPVSANHLSARSERRWTLQSPWQAGDCRSGTCKCACVATARGNGRPTLLIGDGASDFCAAHRVDFVFAKGRLIDYCRNADIPFLPIASFDEASARLRALFDGSLIAESMPMRAVAGIRG